VQLPENQCWDLRKEKSDMNLVPQLREWKLAGTDFESEPSMQNETG
jgi:hypothetical protein